MTLQLRYLQTLADIGVERTPPSSSRCHWNDDAVEQAGMPAPGTATRKSSKSARTTFAEGPTDSSPPVGVFRPCLHLQSRPLKQIGARVFSSHHVFHPAGGLRALNAWSF